MVKLRHVNMHGLKYLSVWCISIIFTGPPCTSTGPEFGI